MSFTNPFTTAFGMLWWLVTKIAFGSLVLPGVLLVSAIDLGSHSHLTTDQLWLAALLVNLGLCGVWYRFYGDLAPVWGAAQTHFFVGLLLALVSLFCQFGLQIGFFLRTFQRFALFDFGM